MTTSCSVYRNLATTPLAAKLLHDNEWQKATHYIMRLSPCEMYPALSLIHIQGRDLLLTADRSGRIVCCQVATPAAFVFTLGALYGTSMLYAYLNSQGTPCILELLIKNIKLSLCLIN
jgi:prepilin signal peptidase PulO-like enzyme (type II secretory pathway)